MRDLFKNKVAKKIEKDGKLICEYKSDDQNKFCGTPEDVLVECDGWCERNESLTTERVAE